MNERGKHKAAEFIPREDPCFYLCTQLTLSLLQHRIILFSAMLQGDTTIREGSHDLPHLLRTYCCFTPVHLMGKKHFEVKNTSCAMGAVG